MHSPNRVAVISGLFLSLLLLPAFSKATYAARIDIDNDVAIEWQQKAFANFLPTVVNGDFVVTNVSELNAVLVNIAITRTDLLGGVSLTLNLVDPASGDAAGTYSQLLVGGTALTLTYTAGEDNSGQPLAGVDPDNDGFHAAGSFPKALSLSDFHNSLQTFDEENGWTGPSTQDLLLQLLATGPIGFSLDGHVYGSVNLPADIPCQQDPTVCKTFPGSASITVTGGESFPGTTTVPEPASLSLLLVGTAGLAALRRRRS